VVTDGRKSKNQVFIISASSLRSLGGYNKVIDGGENSWSALHLPKVAQVSLLQWCYTGWPTNVKPTYIFAGNIILVTFECIGKIQWFLANLITV